MMITISKWLFTSVFYPRIQTRPLLRRVWLTRLFKVSRSVGRSLENTDEGGGRGGLLCRGFTLKCRNTNVHLVNKVPVNRVKIDWRRLHRNRGGTVTYDTCPWVDQKVPRYGKVAKVNSSRT